MAPCASCKSSCSDCSRLYHIAVGARREFRVFRQHAHIKHLLGLVIFLYISGYPLRRLSHYFHRTLPDYWPQEYSTPAALATVDVKNVDGIIEVVSVADLLARVAPNHGLDIQKIAIRKEDFVQNCHGCIAKPLRLFDLGHFMTPDWSASPVLSEYCMSAIFAFSICLVVCLVGQRNPRINAISMIARALRVGIPLHLMRPLFHMSTGLPGPAMHCQNSVVEGAGSAAYLFPEGDSLGALLSSIFSLHGPKSCGDLMFSGHMINATVMLLTCLRYAPTAYPSRKWAWILTAAFLFSTQAFLIVSSRNHYTVDVVGSIVMVFLFFNLDAKVFPMELVAKVSNDDSVEASQESLTTHFADLMA